MSVCVCVNIGGRDFNYQKNIYLEFRPLGWLCHKKSRLAPFGVPYLPKCSASINQHCLEGDWTQHVLYVDDLGES